MDSIPPATAISASPALISAAASMIDLSPEPQTRLVVVALRPSGRPPHTTSPAGGVARGGAGSARKTRSPRCVASRRLTDPGLQDLAHEALVDRRPVRQTRPLDRGPDRDAAQLDRRRARARPT